MKFPVMFYLSALVVFAGCASSKTSDQRIFG